METLIIHPGKFTPGIIFDHENKIFEITGFSLPENVSEFYMPVLDWMDKFYDMVSKNYGPVLFNFTLVYYNSGSFKALIILLQKIIQLRKKGIDVKIEWVHDEEDSQVRDTGRELSELVDFPFKFIVRS